MGRVAIPTIEMAGMDDWYPLQPMAGYPLRYHLMPTEAEEHMRACLSALTTPITRAGRAVGCAMRWEF